MSTISRPPLPPFDVLSATQKVRAAEDAWNTCCPEKVSLAYTPPLVGVIGQNGCRGESR